MRLSEKTIQELYDAIYTPIMDARIKLKLAPKDDLIIAQLENKIWHLQKQVLRLKKA